MNKFAPFFDLKVLISNDAPILFMWAASINTKFNLTVDIYLQLSNSYERIS